MKSMRTLGFVVVLLAFMFGSIPIAQGQDAPAGANTLYMPAITSVASDQGGNTGEVVSTVISKADQDAALAFWTRTAVAQAQPLAMPVQAGPAEVDMTAAAGVSGPAGSSPAGLASPDALKIAQAAFPDDWVGADDAATQLGPDSTDGTSQVYSSYIVNAYTPLQKIYPHVWVGRLSFLTPGGTSYCSGTSISNNVMLTAAHCLYDTTNNRWYSRWVLTPAYRNGNAPYGTFAATQCWVLGAWVNLSGSYSINSWARYDVGVCKMGKNTAGQTLNGAVGWMGRQWNWPYVRHFHDLGYPFNDYRNVALPNAGLYLRTCAAESFQQTTETRGMGCNWGPGISGGPWMVGYQPTIVTGAADGVNSGLFIGTQNLYGARFNSSNIVPLCTAAAC